jgi:hypothetical protein
VDLFRNNLLPEHRTLISLEARPLLGPIHHPSASAKNNSTKNAAAAAAGGGDAVDGKKAEDGRLKSSTGVSTAADLVKSEHVLVWVFEAGLKARFSQLVEHLSVAQKDNTSEFRKFGLDCAADLLDARPEQERTLLAMVKKYRWPSSSSSSSSLMSSPPPFVTVISIVITLPPLHQLPLLLLI